VHNSSHIHLDDAGRERTGKKEGGDGEENTQAF